VGGLGDVATVGQWIGFECLTKITALVETGYAHNADKGETSVSPFLLRNREQGSSVNPLDNRGLIELHIVIFGFPNQSFAI